MPCTGHSGGHSKASTFSVLVPCLEIPPHTTQSSLMGNCSFTGSAALDKQNHPFKCVMRAGSARKEGTMCWGFMDFCLIPYFVW